MYLSVAHDKEGAIRVYMNLGDTLYATEALRYSVVNIYLETIMEAIGSWSDPLKVTTWEEVKKDSPHAPATARKAVGYNDTHREVWCLEYDDKGRSRNAVLLETGSRHVIATTFIITLSKMFMIDLQATLDAQKEVVYTDTSFNGKHKKKETTS